MRCPVDAYKNSVGTPAINTVPPADLIKGEFGKLAGAEQVKIFRHCPFHTAKYLNVPLPELSQGPGTDSADHHRIHLSTVQRIDRLALTVEVIGVGVFIGSKNAGIAVDDEKKCRRSEMSVDLAI